MLKTANENINTFCILVSDLGLMLMYIGVSSTRVFAMKLAEFKENTANKK